MAAAKKKGTMFPRWLKYVLLLISGSGAGLGGWQLKDHPLLYKLVGYAQERTGETDKTPEEFLADKVSDTVKTVLTRESFSRSGRYSVQIDEVQLDETAFRKRQTVNIQARIVQPDAKGVETVLWSSRPFGDRPVVVGEQPLTAGWSDRPFVIEWKPGDRYVLEIWNGKGWRPSKLFAIDADDPEEFPLRTQTLALETKADGKKPAGGDAGSVVLKSKRVGDLDSKDDAPSDLAERPRKVR